MKKLTNILFSPITMGILLLLAAFFMGAATFIENDFGAQAARKAVYNAKWFELLLLLLAVNLTGSIFKRKLYKKKNLSVFLFHIAFVIMLIGAAITRYYGFEGIMHIREGDSSSLIVTQEKVLELKVSDPSKTTKTETFSKDFESKHHFNATLDYKDKEVGFTLVNFYPNAVKQAFENPTGDPVVGFILSNKKHRGFVYVSYGEVKDIGGIKVSFNPKNKEADIYFSYKNDSLFLKTKMPLVKGQMNAANSEVSLTDKEQPVQLKTLYQTMATSLVVQEFYPMATITAVPASSSKMKSGKPALILNTTVNGETKQMAVWQNRQYENQFSQLFFNNIQVQASWGYKTIELPISLHLDDFVIDRYPGSMSPSSFSSYVTIHEEGKEPEPFHIYMNNILKMHGYRFYQSSYDKDEKGTVLSVNYDTLGTTVTYIGYFLLIAGIILSMINKNTFFRKTKKMSPTLKTVAIIGFILLGSTQLKAQTTANLHLESVSKKHAEKFGMLLIQDQKGRTKPVYTFASDILRKISRKEELYNLSPVQVFLELNLNYEKWMNVPLIKVSNRDLQKRVGINSKYGAYYDFITPQQGYILQGLVEKAYAKPPAERDKFDKEVIKTDERVNILYGIFSGSYLKIFPVDKEAHVPWQTPEEAYLYAKGPQDSTFLRNIVTIYFQELSKAKVKGNYSQANEFLQGMIDYQKRNAVYELPSEFKIQTEIAYYKWNVFKKLFPFYASIGLVFLFVFLGSVIRGKPIAKWLNKSIFTVIFIGFIAHTIGLAARWYISGHAPMSNGYESMVFISWVTILAGFIFNRYSPLVLSATSILAGLTLMVANLSFMDPEITNLVPVLKSYWLTLHVSVITGSYGFLGLGAILGIINLILFSVQNRKTYDRIAETIDSLTIINHKTLILGLYFLTIGTFLGAIWANESWGRYWGWDPKETWSLITIIVYTLVTHARLIPGVKGVFTFNVFSAIGFFSVLMTYFGVNYYLSGLHSYAGGDPVPIPKFVYVTVALFILLILTAWFKFRLNRELIKQ